MQWQNGSSETEQWIDVLPRTIEPIHSICIRYIVTVRGGSRIFYAGSKRST